MRIQAVACALFYGIVPSRVYETESHYPFTYTEHLQVNLGIAWRWATWNETDSDIEFEIEENTGRVKRVISTYTLSKYQRLVEQALRVRHPVWSDAMVKAAAHAVISKFTTDKQEA